MGGISCIVFRTASFSCVDSLLPSRPMFVSQPVAMIIDNAHGHPFYRRIPNISICDGFLWSRLPQRGRRQRQ